MWVMTSASAVVFGDPLPARGGRGRGWGARGTTAEAVACHTAPAAPNPQSAIRNRAAEAARALYPGGIHLLVPNIQSAPGGDRRTG